MLSTRARCQVDLDQMHLAAGPPRREISTTLAAMTSPSHFELLLQSASSQPEPQRLLFIFAEAQLPVDAPPLRKRSGSRRARVARLPRWPAWTRLPATSPAFTRWWPNRAGPVRPGKLSSLPRSRAKAGTDHHRRWWTVCCTQWSKTCGPAALAATSRSTRTASRCRFPERARSRGAPHFKGRRHGLLLWLALAGLRCNSEAAGLSTKRHRRCCPVSPAAGSRTAIVSH
jgi:hypothetical protein